MALKHDDDGFLIGQTVPDLKRVSKGMDNIRKDVAMIKNYLKMLLEQQNTPPPVLHNVHNKKTPADSRSHRETAEPRLRDSHGRFTRDTGGKREQLQLEIRLRTQNTNTSRVDLLNPALPPVSNDLQIHLPPLPTLEATRLNLPPQVEQQRPQIERQRAANGRFIRHETAEPNINGSHRKRNAQGQFERNQSSSTEGSFLGNAVDNLSDKISSAIAFGTAGLEEISPDVKAFKEVAEPLAQGYKLIFGGTDKKDKSYFAWFNKIWKTLKKTENNREEAKPESGGGFLGGLATSLLGGGLFAALGSILAVIFSPMVLGIAATGIAAWGLFTKSGNKFFAAITDSFLSSWQKSLDWTSRTVFEPMGKKWDALVAAGKKLIDTLVVNPVKNAAKQVKENHAGAVTWTADKMEKTANAVESAKDQVTGAYESGKNFLTDNMPGKKKSMMLGVYKSFINAGYSENQAKAMTAEVGRENDFKASAVFGNHTDAANGATNTGFFSWQGRRSEKLKKRLAEQGLLDKSGKMTQSQASLDVMAKFAKQEMESGQYKGLGDFMSDKNVAAETAAKQLGKGYIKWAYGQDVLSNGKHFNWRKADKKRAGYYRQIDEMAKNKAVNVTEKSTEPPTNMPAGLKIKSTEAIAGGVAKQGTIDFAKALQDQYGGDIKYFSAFNDAYHKKHAPNSGHTKGLKFDAVLNDPNKAAQMQANIEAMAAREGVKVKVLNEYANLSPKATGGHLDVGFANAEEAAKFSKAYAKKQIAKATVKPNLPAQVSLPPMLSVPIIPKPQKIEAMPAVTVPLASDSRSQKPAVLMREMIGQDLPDRKLALIATGGLSAS